MLLFIISMMSLNMDKITADINSNKANEYLNAAKKLIQDNINYLSTVKQEQLIGIYDTLTPENAQQQFTIISGIFGEIFIQDKKESGLWFWMISKSFGLVTLLSYLFGRITGAVHTDLILMGGSFLTLFFALYSYIVYSNMDF